jgi:hypothetical protein
MPCDASCSACYGAAQLHGVLRGRLELPV